MPHNDSWAPKHAHFGPVQPPVRMVHEKQMKDWQKFVCEHVDGPANFSIENHKKPEGPKGCHLGIYSAPQARHVL